MILKRLSEVQSFLRAQKLDGWLVYDFRGTNPFAAKIIGLTEGIFTRRWYLWIPVKGEPKVLAHAIEQHSFRNVGIELGSYSGRSVLKAELKRLLGKAKTIAMEYSPESNIPYVSTVDGGTIDLVRSVGVKVVSSGDLLQLFLTWTPKQLVNHKKAARVLAATKDAAFGLIQERIAQGKPITEFELQQYMLRFINEQGMETDHAPTVAFNEMVGVGHYSPSAKVPRALKPGPVLIDLWCKVPGDNPYADIAWVAHWGNPSPGYQRAFAAIVKARDAGVDLLQARFTSGQAIRGYEVDRMVRQVLAEAGYKDVMRRRTGHSLGINAVHGEVVHFDDFETLDDRLVLPGLGFTIEPGFRLGDYGGHSEINVFTHPDRVEVTTVIQREAVIFS